MKSFVYLSKADVLESNFEVISEFGGNFLPPFNLLNESALDYLIEIVEHGIIFGEVMYPTIESKAALYLFNITENHIFSDGNKRTGLDAMLIFLELNGFQLKEPLEPYQQIPELPEASDSDTILEKLVFEVAESKRTLDELSNWIKQNITAI
jgi:death-on-curing protein